MTDIKQQSLELHAKLKGKIRIQATCEVETKEDLTLIYSPGVGAVSEAIAADPSKVDELTWRKNAVAIFSDGSAVLGLGDIGPLAVLPVLEGKCAIFKRFSNIDAVPILLNTKDVDAIVETIVNVAPSFGAIQLEDISAPRCFEIERRLMERLDMPVMHDDQHGTAIVILAGLINALKVVKKELSDIRVVMNGAGAAGIAAARLLDAAGVQNVIMCDRQGAIYMGREGLNEEKIMAATFTNLDQVKGSLADVAKGADVLIGVSAAGAFTPAIVKSMAKDPIVFALANPVPEILPEVAKTAGVAVLATGRSDFANQVNNALCYPGLFRGMLDTGVKQVTVEIKLKAAEAIAAAVPEPTAEKIIPSIFDPGLHELVAKNVV
ncbi:NADP-dependent malic enzyme [Patescibacteria group bacterium]|jgi:malate dehydrogenase (oxaloacetate-decarboxylating)|nr:NADP-dependent malic enzyme [Patescibacteria group bacterium]